MADERDRWLDKAAADRLLRGEPAVPGAEHHARARAERLRAALDALAEPPPAGTGGLPGELRGEAAAVAAFRAARGSAAREGTAGAELFGSADTVVDLSPPPGPAGSRSRTGTGTRVRTRSVPVSGPGAGSVSASVSASRRRRPARFALAAALASVAVGGLAAAAGAGLLDRDTRDTAGGAPAVSVTSGSSAEPVEGGADPAPAPLSSAAPRPGESRGTSPAPGDTRGAEGRTGGSGGDAAVGGASGGGPATTGPSAGGPTGGEGGVRDRFLLGDSDGAGEGTADKNRDGDRAAQLCRDHGANRLDEEGREKLARLAKGLLRIPRYCQGVLDVSTGGGSRGDAPDGSRPDGSSPSDRMLSPKLVPALPVDRVLGGAGERDAKGASEGASDG